MGTMMNSHNSLPDQTVLSGAVPSRNHTSSKRFSPVLIGLMALAVGVSAIGGACW
ncbi:MAG: hypothetical protein AAFP03_00095 [Cyanobacteria bacterium J06598_3]